MFHLKFEAVKRGFKMLKIEDADSRIYLRPLQFQDIDSIYSCTSDPRITRFLTYNPHKCIEETMIAYRTAFFKTSTLGSVHSFAIILQSTDEFLGILDYKENTNKNVELGYVLKYAAWGNGYMNEALDLLMSYLKEEKGIYCFEVRHIKDNIRSQKVISRCGFEYCYSKQEEIKNKVQTLCYYQKKMTYTSTI